MKIKDFLRRLYSKILMPTQIQLNLNRPYGACVISLASKKESIIEAVSNWSNVLTKLNSTQPATKLLLIVQIQVNLRTRNCPFWKSAHKTISTKRRMVVFHNGDDVFVFILLEKCFNCVFFQARVWELNAWKSFVLVSYWKYIFRGYLAHSVSITRSVH